MHTEVSQHLCWPGQGQTYQLCLFVRYAAFAGAVKRVDVSAQSSGAKVLEGLAHIADQEQLLLRNSPDLRCALEQHDNSLLALTCVLC